MLPYVCYMYIRHRASGTRWRVVWIAVVFSVFFLLDSLPESIRSVSDHLSESLTDSLQGVPAGGCETERAKPHAIAPISRLYLEIPSRNLIINDVSSKNL